MTTGSTESSRHLSYLAFSEYIGRRLPFMLALSGSPSASLFVSEGAASVGLEIEGQLSRELSELQSVSVRRVVGADVSSVQLLCHDERLFEAFYGLACAIADSIQLEGLDIADAIALRVREWRNLLKPVATISERALTGLLGELLVLDALRGQLGDKEALDAWRGTAGEEHDFGLDQCDIEVKSTLGERRDHWVSSLEQLMPSGDRPLYVVSIQFTRAGEAGVLPIEVTARMRRQLASSSPSLARRFDEQLALQSVADDLLRTWETRYRLRTEPILVRVESPVPALTPSVVREALGAEALGRLMHGEYVIRLDGLGVPVSSGLVPQVRMDAYLLEAWA